MSCISQADLESLFSFFVRHNDPQHGGKDTNELINIQSKCKELFEKDYNIGVISNRGGELCATYPPDLVILESCKDKSGSSNTNTRKVNDSTKLGPIFTKSRFARVRTRFPVPVILWRNKNICRSSTLAHKIEWVLQTAHNQVKKQLSYGSGATSSDLPPMSHMEDLRSTDIGLIKQLSVKYILDLMMENRKKKFGVNVCSSEKVDMHDRYNKFALASMPYPGVEFFQEFNQRNHSANDLRFDWNKPADYVELKVAHISRKIAIPWGEYKNWDLVVLTQNYLKLMLQFTADSTPDSGILVHCISGWDRTPLFISLLRISMWADGEVHQSLSAEELLYLTVAYDWLLFSHHLSDRASRGEDIFYFCFYFLQFIASPEFSVRQSTKHSSHNKSSVQAKRTHPPGHHTKQHMHNFNHAAYTYPHHPTRPIAAGHIPHYPSAGMAHSASPIEVPGHGPGHSRRISDTCCNSVDCRCGSWQMMEGLSLADQHYSFRDASTPGATPPSSTPPSVTPPSEPADADYDTDSSHDSSRDSRELEVSDHSASTSWENESMFPLETSDGISHPKKEDAGMEGDEAVTSNKDAMDHAERRAAMLADIGEKGMNFYKQCCQPHTLQQHSSWGLFRLLPRFV